MEFLLGLVIGLFLGPVIGGLLAYLTILKITVWRP